jgi:hypothetical protein
LTALNTLSSGGNIDLESSSLIAVQQSYSGRKRAAMLLLAFDEF